MTHIQRDGTSMVDTIKIEGPKTELIPILRWEEDGGTIIAINDSMPDRQFVRPVPLTVEIHDASLQWNEQFVIEPFQTGTRIDLIKRKAPTKRPSM
jgi:hypothetical protein